MERRTIRCGDEVFFIQRLRDETIGILDGEGRLLFDWPATRAYMLEPIDARSDRQWLAVIHALCRGQWEIQMARARYVRAPSVGPDPGMAVA